MKNLIIILIFIIITSCKSQKNNIFNTSDLSISYANLLKKGYNPIDGHAYGVSKRHKDTTVYFGFNRNTISDNKHWKVKLPSMDSNFVADFFKERYIFYITPITFYENSSDYFFTSLGQLDNIIYFCEVKKENDKAFLYVSMFKAYSRKEIMKNREYYKNIYQKGLSHPELSLFLNDID